MKRIRAIVAALIVGVPMAMVAWTPPARAAVGTVYGPYRVTNTITSGTIANVVPTPSAPPVYEVSNTTTTGAITVTATYPIVIVLNNVTRTGATSPLIIDPGANVTLYLVGTSTYTCTGTSSNAAHQAGIEVAPNQSPPIDPPVAPLGTLTIEGTGSLTANGGRYAAGIGGTYASSTSTYLNGTGTITISSGTVTANGGQGGAGIGGGLNGNGGTMTINGGTVKAAGGAAGTSSVQGGGGAGIGGGGNSGAYTAGNGTTGLKTGNESSWAGYITINGGNITATSASGSAAIGGGFWAGDGYITINGGTINATALSGGTGIGAGGRSTCGHLTINGGDITATGSSQAAGIGNGTGVTGCIITITGGTISASSSVANASGVGGGADASGNAGSATVYITGGNVYSVNKPTSGNPQIRVNYTPTNGPTYGTQDVYAIIVQLQDANGNPLPDTAITVPVSAGGYTYNYTATTDASGNAYLWLPATDYKILFENAAAGTYTDYFLHVAVPANPDQYDPTTNIGVIRLVDNEPAWSLSEKATTKLYGSGELDLNINHNNPCTNTLTTKATCSAGAIAGVKWYREDVTNPVNTIDTFNAGFAAASTANSGTDVGTGADELNLQPGGTANLKSFVMPITHNGRYWVQTHYIAMNTNLDVYTVTYVDVSNIYTPVTVSVRDVNAVTNATIQGYTTLTPTPPATQVGIAFDLDGSTLANPIDGYDTLTYTRNPAAPAPRWTMALPSAPFGAATGTPETSVITLDSAADPAKADKGSTATALLYTVNYTDTDPGTTLTVSKTVNGVLADKTRAFDFAIWLQDENGPVTHTFDCTDQTGQPCADGPVGVTDGTGTFTLADGQSVTLADVPLSTKVMVTEALVVGWGPSYTDSLAPETIVTNNSTPLEDMTEDRVFAFVNTREAAPETGVQPGDAGNGLVLPIGLVALLTLAFLGARAAHRPRPMGAHALHPKGVLS